MNKLIDQKFCHECGEIISIRAEICPKCGVRQPHNALMMPSPTEGILLFKKGPARNKKTAATLAVILGGLGIHQFYLGRPIIGAIYILLSISLIPAFIALIEAINFWFMSDEVFERRHSGQAYTW